MKCLETERLISYAYRLMDEPAASKVRAHLEECRPLPRDRGTTRTFGRCVERMEDSGAYAGV